MNRDLETRSIGLCELFSADKTCFFANKVDGEPICCISTIKFSIDFVLVGCYIVDKSHRSKGYGLQTSKVVLESLSKICNLATDAVIKRCRFVEEKPYWEQHEFEFVASDIPNALAGFHTNGI